MESAQYVVSKIALAMLALVAGCTKPLQVVAFKHANGDVIKVDVTNKTLNLVGKTYTLTDCSNALFSCYRAGAYAVAFPKKCRPHPDIDVRISFDQSIGFEHTQKLAHRTGYSRIHGQIGEFRNYLFTFDEPMVTEIYYSDKTNIRKMSEGDEMGRYNIDAYLFKHVAGTHELRCAE